MKIDKAIAKVETEHKLAFSAIDAGTTIQVEWYKNDIALVYYRTNTMQAYTYTRDMAYGQNYDFKEVWNVENKREYSKLHQGFREQ